MTTTELDGRTALVLGAGGGLGGAAAAALARRGARVAGWDIDTAAMDGLVERIPADGGEFHPIRVDLSDAASIDAGVAATRKAIGDPDILLNITGGPPPSSIVGVDRTVWTKQFQSMVLSVIQVTDHLLPAMRSKGWGRVITSTSSGVQVPIANLGLSNSLRGCLVGWSKTLANEVGGDNITVNTVVPGRIATQRIQQLDEARASREGKDVEAVRAASLATIPAGRYGAPYEFGEVVAFLASEGASFINGTSIRIDGGMIPSIS